MKYFFFSLVFLSCFLQAEETKTHEVYWEAPEYLKKLEAVKTAGKVHCVYHIKRRNFIGNFILPLNRMPEFEGFSEIYKQEITKYEGRESLLSLIIPSLNCLWNDVVFLSPVHPHKHYEKYKKIGYTPFSAFFFKIPVEVLKDKRVTVFKWLDYPAEDPIHDSIESYCELDLDKYQEMDDLPDDTKELYESYFNSENPLNYPPYNFYRIPHVLCQDPIDILDERITVINWADPIEK